MNRQTVLLLHMLLVSAFSIAHAGKDDAYVIDSKIYSVSDAVKVDPSSFFDLEKKKYERIHEIARDD